MSNPIICFILPIKHPSKFTSEQNYGIINKEKKKTQTTNEMRVKCQKQNSEIICLNPTKPEKHSKSLKHNVCNDKIDE